jgi:hypothetical protein
MFKVPLPSSRLCLSFEFDIGKPEAKPSAEKLDAACQEAALAVNKMIGAGIPCDAFRAKMVVIDDDDTRLNLQMVHNYPFDRTFHEGTSGQSTVRYEYFYKSTVQKMFLRVVTDLNHVDGVYAVRVGLHTMEALFGNEISSSSFPKHPQLPIGTRVLLNFVRQVIVGGILAGGWAYFVMYTFLILEWLGLKKKPLDETKVNNIASLFRFQSTKYASEPASYLAFRSKKSGSFKAFLQVVEEWRRKLGIRGYLYLINFSPLVAPGTTSNIRDIGNLDRRYRGAFTPPTPPPGKDVWVGLNCVLADKFMVNNYGTHQHNFGTGVKPVAFMWDWMHMANTHGSAGCITINGVFLCWFRNMPSSLKELNCADVLGEPVAEATQNLNWFKTME